MCGFFQRWYEGGLRWVHILDDEAATHTEGVTLAGGVDFGDDGAVGVAEGAGEVVQEVAGARIGMRLEEDYEAAGGVTLASGLEGGGDFGRVVGVVVHDC